MQSVRESVLPVGTFNPLHSPRFSFRGSGFVVGDGNLLLTNAHVLPDPNNLPTGQLAVLVLRPDGSREPRNATLVRVDRSRDLALLKVDGAALPALTMAPAGGVQEGLEVALVGFPIGGALGFAPVIHRGIVSSLTTIALPAPTAQQLPERTVARLREGAYSVYQLDATAYPGNSGGPLLDAKTGQVVGVINMVLVRSTRESALSKLNRYRIRDAGSVCGRPAQAALKTRTAGFS
ncbi:MAG TPA: serine protease [Rubrivivax sp.]|nr:serine protease [Rubrivivax sp.]